MVESSRYEKSYGHFHSHATGCILIFKHRGRIEGLGRVNGNVQDVIQLLGRICCICARDYAGKIFCTTTTTTKSSHNQRKSAGIPRYVLTAKLVHLAGEHVRSQAEGPDEELGTDIVESHHSIKRQKVKDIIACTKRNVIECSYCEAFILKALAVWVSYVRCGRNFIMHHAQSC